MKSRTPSERLDLERGLSTTARDIEALRSFKSSCPLSLEDYLGFLDRLPLLDLRSREAKRGPRGDEPFVLEPVNRNVTIIRE